MSETPHGSTSFKNEDVVTDGRHTLHLGGELDMCTAPMLMKSLTELPEDPELAVTLDLRELEFIDSSGVRAIVDARGICAARGYEFSLVPGGPSVHRVFELMGLVDVLPFEGVGGEPPPART